MNKIDKPKPAIPKHITLIIDIISSFGNLYFGFTMYRPSFI